MLNIRILMIKKAGRDERSSLLLIRKPVCCGAVRTSSPGGGLARCAVRDWHRPADADDYLGMRVVVLPSHQL